MTDKSNFDKYKQYGAYHWLDIDKSSFTNILKFSLPLYTRYKMVISALPESVNTVVEVGCGDGALSYLIYKKGAKHIIGCDLDKTGIFLAEKQVKDFGVGKKIEFFCKSFKECNFKKHSIDVIILADVIEHIPDSIALLKEIKEAGKPGGYLIMTTPNKKKEGLWDECHVTEYSKHSLIELLSDLFPVTTVVSFMPLYIYKFYRRFKIFKWIFNILSIFRLNVLGFSFLNKKDCMLRSISKF